MYKHLWRDWFPRKQRGSNDKQKEPWWCNYITLEHSQPDSKQWLRAHCSSHIIKHNSSEVKLSVYIIGHTIDLCISIDPVRHHMHSSCVLHSSSCYHMKHSLISQMGHHLHQSQSCEFLLTCCCHTYTLIKNKSQRRTLCTCTVPHVWLSWLKL